MAARFALRDDPERDCRGARLDGGAGAANDRYVAAYGGARERTRLRGRRAERGRVAAPPEYQEADDVVRGEAALAAESACPRGQSRAAAAHLRHDGDG